jgi:hypothetical protein
LHKQRAPHAGAADSNNNNKRRRLVEAHAQRHAFCASRHSACSPVSAVTGRGFTVGLGSSLPIGGSPMLTMLKTLLAAVAIVGLIDAAFTSSRHAEGNGCANCAVSTPSRSSRRPSSSLASPAAARIRSPPKSTISAAKAARPAARCFQSNSPPGPLGQWLAFSSHFRVWPAKRSPRLEGMISLEFVGKSSCEK